MNKSDKNKIFKRCEKMANDFELKVKIDSNKLVDFGDCIKRARKELLKAESIAFNIFPHKKDEYKIIEELLETIEQYRNFMDGKPVDTILRGFDCDVKNAIFYGPTKDENLNLRGYHLNELPNIEDKANV